MTKEFENFVQTIISNPGKKQRRKMKRQQEEALKAKFIAGGGDPSKWVASAET
jgi:hypothetical protein